MAVRFPNDANTILWIAAIGALILFVADVAVKLWTLAKAWF